MAQEEVGYAVAIDSWRFEAIGRGVLKTTALQTNLACSRSHFFCSDQARKEIVTMDAQRFITAQDAVYYVVLSELA
jgi:hypothetical protein